MKKRMLSAVLALIMLFSAFSLAACGEDDDGNNETIGTRVPTTLTLWLPTAEGTKVDDESVAQVEKAINEITQATYSTAIKLKLVDGEDYDAAVEAKLADIKNKAEEEEKAAAKRREEARKAAAKGEKYVDTGAADTDNKKGNGAASDYANEFEAMNAAVFANYPAVESTQFDIFVVHGYDRYKAYCDSFQLSDLDENIKDKSQLLYTYIYTTFLDAVKYDGVTYAIPNNHAMGKYKLMLVNKQIAKDLFYDPAGLNSVASLFTYDDSGISFIEDVAANCPGVTPVVGEYKVPNIKYWNKADDSTFSVLGSLMTSNTTYADVEIGNIFTNTNFINGMFYQKRINEITTPAPVGSTDNFAVGFIEGTAEDIAKYSDKYQVSVIEAPTPTTDDIYGSMLAVSAYTKDLERAMEIVTLINTDTNLRTILQYGVEGIHWKKDVDDNSIMHIISDKYKMNIRDTGNVYLTYPGDGISMDYWKYSKTQNLDSFVSLSNGFNYNNEKTAPVLDELAAASSDIWSRVSAMSAAEFRASTDALRTEVDNLECVKKSLYNPDVKEDPNLEMEESIVYLWVEHLKDLGDN